MNLITIEELELLKKADTPTVCNVIELFDIRPHNTGYMDARIQACYPDLPPMVGYAATATFRSAGPPLKGGDYAGLDGQLASFKDVPEPRVVVFQDLDNPSAAATFGARLTAIVLTGMGSDGREGILDVRAAGGMTIAESEATAVVFGMPNEAIQTGGVAQVLSLPEIIMRVREIGLRSK